MFSKFKKKFSQNFLIDNNIKKKILFFLQFSKNDVVLEIGPGNGFLSNDISFVAKLILVEIDYSLIPFLKKKFNLKKNVLILNDDILTFNFKDFFFKFNKVRIFGNIPYHISSKILFLFIKFYYFIIDVHITLELDLAKKIINSKFNYLSFILNFYFDIDILFKIKKSSFFPEPKVNSCFLRLYPKQVKYILNFGFFNNVTKKFFLNKKNKINIFFFNSILLNKLFKSNCQFNKLSYDEYLRFINFLYVSKNIETN